METIDRQADGFTLSLPKANLTKKTKITKETQENF